MRSAFVTLDPARFDLTIAAAARLLQSWALLSLARVFETEPGGTPPLLWRDYFALRRIFAPPADSALIRWIARRRWRQWTATGVPPAMLPLHLENFALRSSWLGGLARRWPPGVAEAAGDRAWMSPVFRFACQDIILGALRETIVFDPDRLPRVVLHPNTLWLLLATEPRNAALLYLMRSGPGPRSSRIAWAPDPIAPAWLRGAMAEIAASAPHWAGFWDQWLLLQAWSVAPAHRLTVPFQAARVISELPLLEEPSAALALTASGFKASVGRTLAKTRAARPERAADPARPDWDEDRPGSFHRGLIIFSRKERS
jgi:hypothetical protein